MSGEKENTIQAETKVTTQVLTGLVVASSKLLLGMTIAWPAMVYKLQTDSKYFTVSDQDVSLLASLPGIVGMVTSLVSGLLVEYLGPRRVLLLILLPAFASWLLLAFTPYLSLVYVSRVVLCISTFLFTTLFQPYIAEICQPSVRGGIAAIPEIISSIGVLVVFTLPNLLPFHIAAVLCGVPFLLLFVLTFFIPESPYWLVRNNRMDEARVSLLRLRGKHWDVDYELSTIAICRTQNSVWDQMSQLKKRENVRPLLLLLTIFIFRELGGHNAVFSYAPFMFHKAGFSMKPFYCTILMGSMRVICSILASVFMDRVGRRLVFISSTFVCSLAEGICGSVLLMDETGSSWVPLASVMLFATSYGLGQASIPWILTGELLPTPIRSLGSSIISFNYCMLYFAVNYTFLWLTEVLELGGTMLLFTVSNLLLVFIIWSWLPESRGRSLQELETAFTKKSTKGCEAAVDVEG